MENINFIRNFSIISHIDHGKSTLADRFLELTETIPKGKMRPQFLDMMDLEREKGITIKMQPVRMTYHLSPNTYYLNLIDTPGHVDFSYEVSRSLAAVEGAILLVDGTKGVQAQTIANLELAKKQGLIIIPVVNKIDLPHAQVKETKEEIAQLFNIEKEEILAISAKYGTNVKELLEAIIEKIPPPKGNQDKPLRALIFDSKYDSFKGVIAFARIIDGKVSADDKIRLIRARIEGKVKEVGYFKPTLKSTKELEAGEIGFIATGVKDPSMIRVGDTITRFKDEKVEPLAGYKEPKSVVFASIYPRNPDDYQALKEALNKLKLNDAALVFERETKEFLGRGFRCGFLGSLHTEIVCERLRREFNLDLVISTPQVSYKIIDTKGREKLIFTVSDFPDRSEIKQIQEPWVKLEVIVPTDYLGGVLDILKNLKGKSVETKYFGQQRQLLIYEIPLRKIIVGFHDQLKGATQGFASMNYEILGFRPSDLIKLEILIAGRKEEAFSQVVEQEEAYKEGKKIVSKLKDILPGQLFSTPLQAAISGRIIARETIKARRKDVVAPLYGGDYTRKRKLLEKQKKGKKLLKERGKVRIPSEVYLKMFVP